MQKTDLVRRSAGILLLLLGLTVMTGWVLRVPELIQIRPGWGNLMFGAAFCYALSGLILLLHELRWRRQQIRQGAGALLLLWSLLQLLSADLPGISAFSPADLDVWLPDSHAGRVSSPTASVLALAGLVMILMARPLSQRVSRVLMALTAVIFLLGATGVMGHLLQLDLLYAWLSGVRMSMQSALAAMVLAIGLWASWRRRPR
jgi:hypothetical protein